MFEIFSIDIHQTIECNGEILPANVCMNVRSLNLPMYGQPLSIFELPEMCLFPSLLGFIDYFLNIM